MRQRFRLQVPLVLRVAGLMMVLALASALAAALAAALATMLAPALCGLAVAAGAINVAQFFCCQVSHD
jgi:hypothetical protein